VTGGIREAQQAQPRTVPQAQKPGQAVSIHMITGATVTALVLEETLLTSARQVGRALGLITTSAQSRVTWKADYIPKTWSELLAEGSIGHLRVEAREMDPAYVGDAPWIDLYFGDLTPAVIGVNVLGKSGYDWLQAQLKPGEKAIFIVANGISSYKGSGFVRGGIFDRFHLQQGIDKFTFKDLDYENLYGIKADGAPRFKESGLFFLRDTRFASSRAWNFIFLANRLTGETATSKTFKTFSQPYHLPDKYYDVHKPLATRPLSLVERIWRERLLEVIVLTLLLATVMGVFAARRIVTAKGIRLERVHLAVLIASVIIIGLWLKTTPSVTQLFPFARLFDEGVRFGLFLADPLLFVFWLFIAVSLVVWGRGWFCGWICPYGSLLELIHKAASRLLPRNALFEFPQPVHDLLRRARYVILAALIVMAVLSLEWAERLAEIEPFKTTWLVGVFQRDWYLSLYWWVLIAISVFNFRFFCRYVCPLGAALSIGTALRLIGIRRKEFCQKCQICARGCQSRAIDPQGQINKFECLYCLECEVKYSDDQVCPPLIVARRHAEKIAAQALLQIEPVENERQINATGDA
jgi:NosR/NirI family nitrous oxide reductase transcriptional regulator